MKRKIVTIVVIVLVVVLLGGLFLPRHPLVKASELEQVDVWYNGTNVTDEVNLSGVLEVLNGHSRRLAPWIGLSAATPYEVADTWEIDLIQDHRPLHIVVGEDVFCYRSGNDYFHWWTIPEGDQLRAELLALLPAGIE